MILPVLKKTLRIFSFFIVCFSFFSMASESEEDPILQTWTQTLNKMGAFQKGNEFSINKYCEEGLKDFLLSSEDEPYLKIKDDCVSFKSEAEECCSNPKKCSSTGREVAHALLPMMPALYTTYRAYRTSDAVSSGEMSHEMAVAKMCDVQNKVGLGIFGSQLLMTLGTALEADCRSKIATCKKKCNRSLDKFKQVFERCFSSVVPKEYKGSIGKIIKFAMECDDIDDVDSIDVSSLSEAKNYGEYCGLNAKKINMVSKENENLEGKSDLATSTLIPFPYVNKKSMGYLLLSIKAYSNSSAVSKSIKLSGKSDEKQIVNCQEQKDRVVTPRKTPGPISAPAIEICQQTLNQALNPRLPSSSSGPSQISSFAGSTMNKGGNSFLNRDGDWGVKPDPSEGEGGEEGDDDFFTSNKPPLTKNTAGRSPSGASGSRGSGGGGSAGGSGSFAGNPSGRGGGGMPYDYNFGGTDTSASFSGNDPYSSSRGGGSSEAGDSYYSPVASLDKGLGDGASNYDGDMESGTMEDSLKDSSIFQHASQRIQQFCSDHTCIE